MYAIIQRVVTGLVIALLFVFLFFFLSPYFFSLFLILMLLEILIFEWPRLFNVRNIPFWFVMPFYPILPFVLLILLNHDPAYRNLLLFLFTMVASYDVGAYVGGIIFGKHYLAPSISPYKTWEGLISGYFISLFTTFLLLRTRDVSCSKLFVICITFSVILIATAGDLFESWLKRRVGLKDSGSLLPGHGGFLDRLDGILFAVFFFYIFKDYLISILT